jgi:opacity protein-like surface antigen
MLTKIMPVCLVLALAGAAAAQSPKPTPNPANKPLEAPATPRPTPVRSSYRVYDDYDRFGFYIDGGASYAMQFFQDDHGLDPTNGWAMNFRGGYRFDPNWAAEVHLEYYFGEFEFETPNNPSGADLERLDGVNVTAQGKWYILSDWVQPYLVGGAGVGFYHLEPFLDRTGDWDMGPIIRGGPGVDVYITRDLLLMAEVNYVLPFADIEDFHTLAITFGGGFRF